MSYKDTPQARHEITRIDELKEAFLQAEFPGFLTKSFLACKESISQNPSRENIITQHGVLCRILTDCKEYERLLDTPLRKSAIMQIRADILQALKSNHKRLGQTREMLGYSPIIEETKTSLEKLKTEIERWKMEEKIKEERLKKMESEK